MYNVTGDHRPLLEKLWWAEFYSYSVQPSTLCYINKEVYVYMHVPVFIFQQPPAHLVHGATEKYKNEERHRTWQGYTVINTKLK